MKNKKLCMDFGDYIVMVPNNTLWSIKNRYAATAD